MFHTEHRKVVITPAALTGMDYSDISGGERNYERLSPCHVTNNSHWKQSKQLHQLVSTS